MNRVFLRISRFSIFIFTFLFLQFAFSAATLLPAFDSDEEKNEFLVQVQMQIPFADANDMGLLDAQINSVAALKRKFPDYSKWMSEKPKLLTFSVFSKESEKKQSVSLEVSQLNRVATYISKRLQSEAAVLKFDRINSDVNDVLIARTLEQIKLILDRSTYASNGIAVGLAQLVQQQERSAFFKLADIKLQIDYIERLGISDLQLKSTGFRPEVFSLSKETASMSQVLEVARRRSTETERTFFELSYLQFLFDRAKTNALVSVSDKQAIFDLVSSTNFDFAVKEGSTLQTEIANAMASNDPRIQDALRAKFRAFQASVPRKLFSGANQDTGNQTLVAKVFEVPPYLGIHRGCIGGDCSTRSSPMFPYSPWEHVFFIQNPDGSFLGYVTATRVLVDGVSTLYVKDVSGALLSARVGEAVLMSFSKILKHYGCQQLAIATSNFTEAQNHFDTLIAMLGKHNKNGRKVALTFPDKDIRTYIGSNSTIFKSSAHYDSVSQHSEGVLVSDFGLDAMYAVESREGTLPVPEFKSDAQKFVYALQIFATTTAEIDFDIFGFSADDMEENVKILRNAKGSNLETYYKTLTKFFASNGVEFNRAFQNKYSFLFQTGHLKASDAFSTSDPSLRSESERFFIRLAKGHQDYDLLMKLATKWKPVLEKNGRFLELIELYKSRLATMDVAQLYHFSNLGYADATSILVNPANKAKIEGVLESILALGISHLGLPEASFKSSGSNHSIAVISDLILSNEDSETRVDVFEKQLDRVFKPFGFGWRSIESMKLRAAIESAFLKLPQMTNKFYKPKAVEILKKHITQKLVSREQLFSFLSRLESDTPEFKALVETRVEVLAVAPESFDFAELHLFHALGYKKATDTLLSSSQRQAYLKALSVQAFSLSWHNEFEDVIDLMTDLYSSVTPQKIRTTPLGLSVNSFDLGRTTSAALERLNKIASDLLVDTDTLMQLPAFKSRISKPWLSLTDAYTSTNPKHRATTLEFLLSELKLESQEAANRYLDKVDYLRQFDSFKSFMSVLEKTFVEENCTLCAEVLVRLVVTGKISDRVVSNPGMLLRFLSETPLLKLFSAYRITSQNLSISIPDAVVVEAAQVLRSRAKSAPTSLKPVVSEWALKILTTASAKDPAVRLQVQTILAKLIIGESVNLTALKLSMAYVAQGGNLATARDNLYKIYPRAELKSTSNQVERSLFQKFEKLTDHAHVSRGAFNQCVSLF